MLFIGGPGNISGGCAEELIARGHRLAMLKRTANTDPRFADTVRFYHGDRSRPTDVQAALDEFRPDAVVDFACFQPERVEELGRLLPGKVQHYLLAGSRCARTIPGAPTRSPYGAGKRRCEELVDRLETEAGLPATIMRPTYPFGDPERRAIVLGVGWNEVPGAPDEGRDAVLVPGGGNTILHTSCAHDKGRMIGRVVHRRDTVGKSYTCGHGGAFTFDQYMQLGGRVLGVEPELVRVPLEVLLAIDSEEVRGSFLPSLTRFNMCFSVEAFKRDFPDFEWSMSLEEGVRQYVDWYDRHDLFADPDQEIYEDRVIRVWQKCLSHFRL